MLSSGMSPIAETDAAVDRLRGLCDARGIVHMPGGQSGHPLSPYWGAGHDDWARGRCSTPCATAARSAAPTPPPRPRRRFPSFPRTQVDDSASEPDGRPGDPAEVQLTFPDLPRLEHRRQPLTVLLAGTGTTILRPTPSRNERAVTGRHHQRVQPRG